MAAAQADATGNPRVDHTGEFPWQQILDDLQHRLTRATFNDNLAGSRVVSVLGDQIVIGLRSELVADWVENRLRTTIEQATEAVVGRPVTLTFVGGDMTSPLAASKNGQGALPSESGETAADLGSIAHLQSVGPGEAGIYIPDEPGDPLYGHIRTSNYAQRFWRPYVGLIPFSLYELLLSYDFFVKRFGQKWPTIALLSDMLGHGDRYTILGRAARPGYKAQTGALNELVRQRILYYWTSGEGTQTSYYFIVRAKLPLLTPKQVEALGSRRLLEAHAEFLEHYDEFDLGGWQALEEDSLIPDNWWRKYVMGSP